MEESKTKTKKQTNVKIEEFNPFTEWTNSDPHRLLSNVNEQEEGRQDTTQQTFSCSIVIEKVHETSGLKA